MKSIAETLDHADWWLHQYMGLHWIIRKDGLSLVKWFQTKLGRQSRCLITHRRYWVWERPNWTLFVHNIGGISFEVPPTSTKAETKAAWEDFLTSIGTSGKETAREWKGRGHRMTLGEVTE